MADQRSCACPLRLALCRIACCTCFCLCPALISTAQTDPAKADAQTTDAPEADAATKKLMAAHGLFERGLFKLAAQEYADFLSDYPKHAQRTAALYALAICQYRQDDFDKAATLLNATLRDQDFAQRDEVLAVLGHCEWGRKRYDSSLAAFDELLAKHPSSKHVEAATLNRAQVLYAAGKHKEAAEGCRQFLARFSKSDQKPDALYVLGLCQRSLGDHENAAATFDRLAREHPQSAYQLDAMLLRGQALEAQGKLDAAIEQYQRATQTASTARQGDARYALGAALEKAGKHAEAAAQLAAAAAAPGPYARAARLQLASAQLGAGQIADARQTFTAILKDDADRATDARYGLAQCEMAEKRFDFAKSILEELLRQQPPPLNSSQIALDRANCLLELGQFEAAATEFEKIASDFAKSPQAAEAIYRQAYCLHRLKQYDKSHMICARFSQLPTSDLSGPVAELDAQNLFLLAKYTEAGQAFEALAKSAKPDAKQLLMRLRVGQCAHFAGDYPKAVELLTPLAADPHIAADEQLQPAIFLLGDALLQVGKHAQAAEALARFVGLAKGDIGEAQFKLALALLGNKDEARAQKVLVELTRGSDDSPWVQRGLVEYAKLARKTGRTDQAAAALRRVLAVQAPDDCAAGAMYLSGWLDFDGKRFVQAATTWKSLAEKYPKQALAVDAAFHRGVALREAGQWDEALAALEQFASDHPDSANAPIAKQLAAACLSAAGKNSEAAARLASLAQGPTVTDAVLYDLAWAQRGQKKNADAMQTYRRLIQEHPSGKLVTPARAEWAELLYGDQKYTDAEELLQAAAADATADPKVVLAARYRLAWCYQKLGKFDKAADAFSRVTDEVKNDDAMAASSLLQAGLAFAEQSKWQSAEKSLSQLVERYPDDRQISFALLKLGEVRAERGDYESSAKAYTIFLDRFPKDPQVYRAHFGIGWSLENRKKFDEARAAYQKVIASHNGDTAARAQFQIGETFLAQEKFDQAIPALLAVEDVYAYPQWSARALLESGRAFEHQKQLDQAKQQYTQLVTKYKDAPEAAMAQDRLKAIKPSN